MKKSEQFRSTEYKLVIASGLALFHSRSYNKAALKLLVQGSSALLTPWTGTLLHPGDPGLYGTLCALATMDRSEIKRKYAAGDNVIGEGEGMKDLVDAWLGSRFRAVIQLLDKHSVYITPQSYHLNYIG